MVIILHCVAVVLKLTHLFFNGLDVCWYILVANRNTSLFLISIANYILIKAIYNRCMQFQKAIDVKHCVIYNKFLANFKLILDLLKLSFEFWFISFVFSNVDLYTSYFYGQIYTVFLVCELVPYLYIFIRAIKLLDRRILKLRGI